jgi:hypothetical protein
LGIALGLYMKTIERLVWESNAVVTRQSTQARWNHGVLPLMRERS